MVVPYGFTRYRRGQSAVVGNILLVAIVLLVGSVVAITAFGLLDDIAADAPQAQFSTTEVENGVGILHRSGDVVDTDQLIVRVGDEELPVADATDKDELAAGDKVAVQPTTAAPLNLVWKQEGDSAVLQTFDSYTVRFTFSEGGNPHNEMFDVSRVNTVDVELSGAGGGNAGPEDNHHVDDWFSSGGTGGYASGIIDVSSVDTLDLYPAESGASNGIDGGWGWKDGGDADVTNNYEGGGGGGGTAILIEDEPIVVAGGGGGGTGYATCHYTPGGGGGSGGLGGWMGFGGFDEDAEGGEGDGNTGGDGGGGSMAPNCDPTEDEIQSNYIPAADGTGEIVESELFVTGTTGSGNGAGSGEHGFIEIEVSTDN